MLSFCFNISLNGSKTVGSHLEFWNVPFMEFGFERDVMDRS